MQNKEKIKEEIDHLDEKDCGCTCECTCEQNAWDEFYYYDSYIDEKETQK